MSIKTLLIICAQALLIQSISTQCIGAYGAYDELGYRRYGLDRFGYDGFAYGAPFASGICGFGPANLAASRGPGLAVTSASPLLPSGVSVLSESGYEGALAVGGAVPFLGTVALEGALPTAGAGAIAYDCGNGAVTITTEDIVAYGFAEPLDYGYGFNGPLGFGGGFAGFAEPFGYGNGLARPFEYGARCGCGGFY